MRARPRRPGSFARPLCALLTASLFCLCAAGAPVAAFNYRGGEQGTVTFDHASHAARGYVCLDCHTKFPPTGTQLFQTRRQGLISLAQHSSDTACFACHNGQLAFDTCRQCHRR
jgi:c(7)-type cytochrome triheme protein